ncbi:MAG: accessory Sec system translocase SecA2 [Roseburia sp.]|nr:accessory Sec system translocase SecA2 [Roseburia sp.]MCM1099130.1 accessory Sec system translocase SecA2 [Ruminococcus flavefaciens]
MREKSDEELAHLTVEFKGRLAAGESLDDLLPEAYAAICEADYRLLGKAPYDVQVLGAIAMHQGYLAEMNTGEGKTLMATMPLYLNALTGKSTILVTANGYLAARDAEEMGPVYRFMGLTVTSGSEEDKGKPEASSEDSKKKMYEADIVYTTHGGLAFDYLFNNLVPSKEDRFMREFYFVIIDEADSVLLDAAKMPLVVAGAPRVQSNLYDMTDFFVTTLEEDRDYEMKDKAVWFTEEGIQYAETFFRIDNFYSKEHFEINRHVTLALRAHTLFEKDKDYMISEKGEVELLDEGSGRMLKGVKLHGGQHQALEAKEKAEVSQETRSMASITYQSLFTMFPKMAGMSGTMADASDELLDLYKKKVLVIPPNRPLQRKDLKDRYFIKAEEQYEAAIDEVAAIHETGRPILIVATTIGQTEIISRLLMEEGIPHCVLNANNAFWEAEMIREAGQPGAVTVATSMAGRGTDIRLGEGVKELGGLAVIGIGRMANTRQERQARGRAGRQGDPGTSQFFVSLEDKVVAEKKLKKVKKYVEGKKRVGRRKLKKLIDRMQALGEEQAVFSRKQAAAYDDVLKYQRDLMYSARNQLLDGGTLPAGTIMQIARENIRSFLREHKKLEIHQLNRYILDNLSYRLEKEGGELSLENPEAVEAYLLNLVMKGLEEQKEKLGGKQELNEFIRVATLSTIDNTWVEQVDYLQQLQFAVSGRSSAQRNPVFEYQKEALKSFREMERTAKKEIIRNILLSDVFTDEKGKLHILFP